MQFFFYQRKLFSDSFEFILDTILLNDQIESFLFLLDQLIFYCLFADLFINGDLLFMGFEHRLSLIFEEDFEFLYFLSVIIVVLDSFFGESLDFSIFLNDGLTKGCVFLGQMVLFSKKSCKVFL